MCTAYRLFVNSIFKILLKAVAKELNVLYNKLLELTINLFRASDTACTVIGLNDAAYVSAVLFTEVRCVSPDFR